MTYSKIVTLFCDGDGCPNSYNSTVGRAMIAREKASETGWTYSGGNDYCPECHPPK